MERKMDRLEQYSRCECIEIARVLKSITNDLLEEHFILIFEKLRVVMEPIGIVACHRLRETGKVIVKLLNKKDGQNVIEEKHKLKSINLYDMITLIPTTEEKSSVIKAFAHTIANFMVW